MTLKLATDGWSYIPESDSSRTMSVARSKKSLQSSNFTMEIDEIPAADVRKISGIEAVNGVVSSMDLSVGNVGPFIKWRLNSKTSNGVLALQSPDQSETLIEMSFKGMTVLTLPDRASARPGKVKLGVRGTSLKSFLPV